MTTNPFEPPTEVNEPPDPMRDPTQLEVFVRAIGSWVYRSKFALVLMLLLSALFERPSEQQRCYNWRMESISRTVSEFAAPDRQAIEHLLGHSLRDDQRVTISVQSGATSERVPSLPAWLDLYAGLSDEEVSELENAILLRDRSVKVVE